MFRNDVVDAINNGANSRKAADLTVEAVYSLRPKKSQQQYRDYFLQIATSAQYEQNRAMMAAITFYSNAELAKGRKEEQKAIRWAGLVGFCINIANS